MSQSVNESWGGRRTEVWNIGEKDIFTRVSITRIHIIMSCNFEWNIKLQLNETGQGNETEICERTRHVQSYKETFLGVTSVVLTSDYQF